MHSGPRRAPLVAVLALLVLAALAAEAAERAARRHGGVLTAAIWPPTDRCGASRRGHELAERPDVGKMHAVRLCADGKVVAAADPRDEGGASVVREYD